MATKLYLVLLAWICCGYITLDIATAQSGRGQLCTSKSTVMENHTEKCGNFMQMIRNGYQLNRKSSNFTSLNQNDLMNKIMVWSRSIPASPDCVFSKRVSKETKQCCDGWGGDKCLKPVCEPPCMNGGICLTPDRCTCSKGFAGYRCGEKIAMLKKNHHIGFATCHVSGIYSYRTFDGTRYDFGGTCKYTLASKEKQWFIEIESYYCKTLTTCKKKVILNLVSQGLIIEVFQCKVTVNDKPIDLTNGHLISGVTITQENGMIRIDNQPLGIRMKMGCAASVYLTLTETHSKCSLLKGLCGNYNYDSSDDFQSLSGKIMKNSNDFANTYLVQTNTKCDPSFSIPDFCKNNPLKDVAAIKCSYLQSTEVQPCRSLVETESWIKVCSNEICSANESLQNEVMCKVFERYSEECREEGVVVQWRPKDICRAFTSTPHHHG